MPDHAANGWNIPQWGLVRREIGAQCAPVLAGVKSSNILISRQADSDVVEQCLLGTGIRCRLLYRDEEKGYWLLYRSGLLARLLAKDSCRVFLREYGYKEPSLDADLERLQNRFCLYQRKETDFPHEMGVFLGYPLADVKGFIRHKGQNYLYAGYWKVYENEAEARSLFQIYASVKAFTVHELEQGKMFWQIVVMFPKLYEKECIK